MPKALFAGQKSAESKGRRPSNSIDQFSLRSNIRAHALDGTRGHYLRNTYT